jgi:MFS family permease
MFLILRNPRFRLLWTSIAFNDMGFIFLYMANGWLALTVTDSPFWVGAAAGMSGLGLTLCSIPAGVLADRLDRRKLSISCHSLRMAMASALAVLALSGRVELWHLLVLAFLDGTMVAVYVPSRLALGLDVVGRERLLSATSAIFAASTLTGIVTPLAGGRLLDSLGIGWAYVAAASAFLTAGIVLLNLRGVSRRVREKVTSPWQDLKRGVGYVLATPAVRLLVLVSLAAEGFGWAHEAMLPVMARDVLAVGASGLGYLLTAGNMGATASTLIMSNIADIKEKGRLLVVGFGGFGLFLVLFAASPWFGLSLVLLGLAYAMAMAFESALSTLLQVSVPDEMRGRVLSFQTLTWGVTGVSGFHTGAIASALSAPVAIAIGGGVILMSGLGLLRWAARFQPRPAGEGVGD